ncbi:hypothetical protein AB1K70_14745 [Bremerella sp. JC770]|uniref:hypothetical protein n=1 Tax=Bremerella sp. JC770 TaxID=3232137 RepID=UPI0034581F1B
MNVVRSCMVGILLSSLALAGNAADRPEKAPIGDEVLQGFHVALDGKQYELAEMIARGVLAKHGEVNDFAKAMVVEIEKIKEEKRPPGHAPRHARYQKVYNMEKPLAFDWEAKDDNFSAKADQFIFDATQSIGPRWKIYNCSAAPFSTNLSIVVSAPQEIHDDFADLVQAARERAEKQ